jgi:Rne/Rng family ribonuclease
MSKIIIDATHSGELRVAVIDKINKLIDLEIEREGQQQKKANIYKGVISSIEPSLGAVFVNYGSERHGFLPIKDISKEYYLTEPKYQADPKNGTENNDAATAATTEQLDAAAHEDRADATIEEHNDESYSNELDDEHDLDEHESDDDSDLHGDAQSSAKRQNRNRNRNQLPINLTDILQVGQELVVQVEKEERGNKGAALTTYISLAGAYLVLMPNNPTAGGVSRRIEGEERESVRGALQSLNAPENMGLIVRTAGVGKSAEELQWDLNILLQYWEAVKQAAVAEKGPYLIHQESDAVIRAIRDYLRAGVEQIVINDKECFQRAKTYINRIRPSFISHLRYYDDALPIFSHFQVEKQIEACYARDIRLPSGGSIVIDHTEALVSIDINSARATRGSDIEETALHTNLEAAQEIARQLRIRDIGGLVVIDFIDMTPNKNQREVENKLRDALKMDRARIQIGKISRFGLLEMSRQRVGQSLRLASHVTCPQCNGQGTIRSIESLSFSLLHIIQEQAAKTPNTSFTVQLPIDVATYMINEKRQSLAQIELAHDAHIVIVPNHHLVMPNYLIKQNKIDKEVSERKQQASYKLLRQPKMQTKLSNLNSESNLIEIPAVHKYMPQEPIQSKKQPTGLFKQLWNKVLGIDDKTEEAVRPTNKNTQKNKSRPQNRNNKNRPQNNSSANQDNNNAKQNNSERSKDNKPARSNVPGNKPQRADRPNVKKPENKPENKQDNVTDNKQNPRPQRTNRKDGFRRTISNPAKIEVGPNASQQEILAAAQLQNTINQLQQYTQESIQTHFVNPPQHNTANVHVDSNDMEGNVKPQDEQHKPIHKRPRSSGNRRRYNNRRPNISSNPSDATAASGTNSGTTAASDAPVTGSDGKQNTSNTDNNNNSGNENQ